MFVFVLFKGRKLRISFLSYYLYLYFKQLHLWFSCLSLYKLIIERYSVRVSRDNVATMYRIPCSSALSRSYSTPGCALKSEQEKLDQWIRELNSNVIIKIARVEADGKMTKFVNASYNYVTKKASIDS